MHSKGGPLLVPIYSLMRRRTSVTSGDQELPQAKPSLMKKGSVIDGDIRAHLVRAWVMMS